VTRGLCRSSLASHLLIVNRSSVPGRCDSMLQCVTGVAIGKVDLPQNHVILLPALVCFWPLAFPSLVGNFQSSSLRGPFHPSSIPPFSSTHRFCIARPTAGLQNDVYIISRKFRDQKHHTGGTRSFQSPWVGPSGRRSSLTIIAPSRRHRADRRIE
jgi:hypothetical protein